eukprot:TRINITY_DN3488_c0_g1_i1.p1 TRINITY_DN3488_c0_g1~~TRINITY_DN3488_c0_g1_i1.p1  ORF type:complete len:276 (+),score=61.14 TRINITY_DN3488_c0_g1_i1:71-898(+)
MTIILKSLHSPHYTFGRCLKRGLVSLSLTSDSIAIVELNRPPVNALNVELLNKIECTFKDLCKDPSVKGILLTSFNDKIFSSGLDLKELLDSSKVDSVGTAFRNLSATLYGSVHKPFAAAISGYAPAGGTLLSMCSDYRVATPKSVLGLNESVIGIVAPEWMNLMYENLIGPRQAELALMLGSLYPSEEALRLGLIDEIAEDKEAAMAKCEQMLRRLIHEPEAKAREISKAISRGKVMKSLEADADGLELASFFKKPEVQANITAYVESLKKRKK